MCTMITESLLALKNSARCKKEKQDILRKIKIIKGKNNNKCGGKGKDAPSPPLPFTRTFTLTHSD